MNAIRPPAVAGSFYPGQRDELSRTVDSLLSAAPAAVTPTPKALIVPHAGYIYSGPVAASAYAQLKPAADRITRVILLGPVHRVPVQGLALPGTDSYATPLGAVPVDTHAAAAIAHLPQVVTSQRAHALEHSLEVHLPFLQRILTAFSILPLAVGDATPGDVAEVIEILWGGDETLFLISSDLSHYLPYAEARARDRATSDAILALTRRPLRHDQACGGTPINGLLLAAQHHGLHPRLLDLRNSGDTAGDRDRVVGYGAFAFDEVRGHDA
jgi:AmmeMemoRadiSam system protein B